MQYRPFIASGVSRAQAKQRLRIPGHPEAAFCDTVYATLYGCTVNFATSNPNPVPNPAVNADWTGTSADPRGNVSNGFLRGDSFEELDAGVNKMFFLPENLRLEFRGQFYNVLIRSNFTAPGMTRCSTSFGRITSTYGPGRIGQIQARLIFLRMTAIHTQFQGDFMETRRNFFEEGGHVEWHGRHFKRNPPVSAACLCNHA